MALLEKEEMINKIENKMENIDGRIIFNDNQIKFTASLDQCVKLLKETKLDVINLADYFNFENSTSVAIFVTIMSLEDILIGNNQVVVNFPEGVSWEEVNHVRLVGVAAAGFSIRACGNYISVLPKSISYASFAANNNIVTSNFAIGNILLSCKDPNRIRSDNNIQLLS